MISWTWMLHITILVFGQVLGRFLGAIHSQVQIFCQAPRSFSSQKLALGEFIWGTNPKNGWFKNLISITWVLWSCSCLGVFKWRWCKWQENVWRIYQYLNSIKKQCKLRIRPRPGLTGYDRIALALSPQGSNGENIYICIYILRIWATFFLNKKGFICSLNWMLLSVWFYVVGVRIA